MAAIGDIHNLRGSFAQLCNVVCQEFSANNCFTNSHLFSAAMLLQIKSEVKLKKMKKGCICTFYNFDNWLKVLQFYCKFPFAQNRGQNQT